MVFLINVYNSLHLFYYEKSKLSPGNFFAVKK